MDRTRVGSLFAVALGLAASFALYFTSPETTAEDAALYVGRAAALQGASEPGSGQPFWPSSTAWISYPLSAAQRVGAWMNGARVRAAYLAETEFGWRLWLRACWSCLAGLLLVRAARSWATTGRAVGRAVIVLCLLAAPLLSVGVARLLPAVPAALLLGELLASALREGTSPREDLRAGLLGGLLLGWFPFAAVGLPLVWALHRLRGASASALIRAAALAAFLGLVLEPARLREPGEILTRAVNEWRREGGWSGPGGDGLFALLGLVPVLGASAWMLWGPAAWQSREPGRRAHLLAAFGLWALAVLLPALSGLRRPGNLQWAVGPWLLVWGLGGFASWRPLAGRPRVAWGVAAVIALAGALSARWTGQVESTRTAERVRQVRAEVFETIGRDRPGVSELTLSEGPGDSLAARVFSLPRDSRAPGRYDFAYWPRWYAGFGWVLLSGRRVSENLARPEAELPRRFYAEVERHGELQREWGRGETGFRLYRIREGSVWNRPLSEEELEAVPGSPERAWFLSQLGSLYLEAGDAREAEAVFRAGIRWDPDSPVLYSNLGTACLRLNDPAAAARAFESGLRLAPESFELLWNLGLACSSAGLWERGEGVLRRAAAARPDFAPVHYELGRVFLAQGRNEPARLAFRRYLELDPSTPRRPAVEAQLRRLEGSGGR